MRLLIAVFICAVVGVTGCGGAVPFEPMLAAQPLPVMPTPAAPPVEAPVVPPAVAPVTPPVPPPVDRVVADPLRGESSFMRIPRADLLGCADCHSDNPVVRNFGNIFSGRNAVDLIQRAIANNTGGMGYLGAFFSAADLTDIAAYLGNSPGSLRFPATAAGSTSAPLSVTVSTSTKVGIAGLSLSVEGDFLIVGGTCGNAVERFSSCRIDVAYRPGASGASNGVLLISHDATPAPVRILLNAEAPRSARGQGLPSLAVAGHRVPGSAAWREGVGNG